MRIGRLFDALDLIDREKAVGHIERAVEQRQHARRRHFGRLARNFFDRPRIVVPAEEMIVVLLHIEVFERHVGRGDHPVGAGPRLV